ncbi:hypothetical protein [Halocatena marina]|uniref:hypothetical protein n=1 Tax=Halocatena marina TaxID=2934937 RepID=UPI0020107764|nr:hypothetical protein [Halocatena marina]
MDPTKKIWQLIEDNWDNSQTSLASEPEFQTGWYSRDQKLPAITVTGKNEGVLRGGETGFTATHSITGKAMQRWSGFVLVDAVAGTHSDCEGIGVGGDDLNPKLVRQELKQHAQQIIIDTQRTSDFRATAPDGGRDVEDTSDQADVKPVFRHQFQARFIYDKLPNP